jgi:hypothetical protein
MSTSSTLIVLASNPVPVGLTPIGTMFSYRSLQFICQEFWIRTQRGMFEWQTDPIETYFEQQDTNPNRLALRVSTRRSSPHCVTR